MNRSLAGALITSALFLAGCGGGGMTQPAVPAVNDPITPSSGTVQTEFQQELALGYYQASCGAAAAGEARCFAYMVTETGQRALGHGLSPMDKRATQATSTSGPWEPSDLQSAYGTTAAAAANGAGKTVAIVDAYNDPKLAADLGRLSFGVRLARVHHEQRLPAHRQSKRRDDASGEQCVLEPGDLAGRRHGLGELPEMQHPGGRSELADHREPRGGRERGRQARRDRNLEQLRRQ